MTDQDLLRPHHWTKSELKYLGEPFTKEWRERRNILINKRRPEGNKDTFAVERFYLDRSSSSYSLGGAE